MTRQIGQRAFSVPSRAAAPVRKRACFQKKVARTAAMTAAMPQALKPGILSPAKATMSQKIGSIASRKLMTIIKISLCDVELSIRTI